MDTNQVDFFQGKTCQVIVVVHNLVFEETLSMKLRFGEVRQLEPSIRANCHWKITSRTIIQEITCWEDDKIKKIKVTE